jgi:hypothetical protein
MWGIRWEFAIAVAVVSAVLGCGGGNAGGDAGPDADPLAPDARTDGSVTPQSCDPVAQDCPAGLKCSLIPGASAGEPAEPGCVEDTGDLGPMQSCTPATPTIPDACERGLVCRGETDPHCLEFCASDPTDTCGPGTICAFDVDLDGDLFVDVQFCALECDPLAQDCPDSSTACYPSRRGTVCAPEGAGDVPVGEGGYCPYANACAEGLGCFGSGSDWSCYRLCDPYDGVPGCGSGQSCVRVENEVWGICLD